MSAVKDQALCLRTSTYSETSQIVTLFGRTTGRLRAIAKGSRRPRSKFDGGVELLTAGNIVYYPPRAAGSLATLGEFHLIEPFTSLRSNLLALYCSQYAAEILAEFTEDFDPHENLYDAIHHTLQNLTRTDRPDITLLSFELTLLQEIGLTPVWRQCAWCRASIPTGLSAYFSSTAGGMVCQTCSIKTPQKRLVKPTIVNLLQNPAQAPAAEPGLVVDAHDLLCYHQCELLGRSLKTMNLTGKLLRKHCSPPPKQK